MFRSYSFFSHNLTMSVTCLKLSLNSSYLEKWNFKINKYSFSHTETHTNTHTHTHTRTHTHHTHTHTTPHTHKHTHTHTQMPVGLSPVCLRANTCVYLRVRGVM